MQEISQTSARLGVIGAVLIILVAYKPKNSADQLLIGMINEFRRGIQCA